MRRRAFIAGLGGAAAWPLVARAQQPALPVIGYLGSTSPEGAAMTMMGFRDGLREGGYIVGQNVNIEYRWANSQYARLPALAVELVSQHVAAIFASGTFNSALAAKAATTTIPIVFVNGSDAVAIGLVASVNRPGGNITGVSNYNSLLGAKRLGLLHELSAKAKTFAFLLAAGNPSAEIEAQDAQVAAQAAGVSLHVMRVSGLGDFERAIGVIKQLNTDALMVGSDATLVSQRAQVVNLIAQCSVPAIYTGRDFPYVGGLMSYGASLAESYRQGGIYMAKILKGAKPADLPVLEPTKYELVINLKTAKALGIEIPPTLLARADEVIE